MNPSRPVHRMWEPNPYAQAQVIAAEGEGALAVVSLFTRTRAPLAPNATIIYADEGTQYGHQLTESLKDPRVRDFRLLANMCALMSEWERLLQEATMGTFFYAAGEELFLDKALHLAAKYGVEPGDCQTELRGSISRRVHCVHCRRINDGIATETLTCFQCGIRLQVRDHYSRRLNAFMGVAEEPLGKAPELEANP